MGEVLLFLGCLVFIANICALLFSKKRIPDVLFLILIGILLGPVLKIITLDDFGKTGSVLTTVTLVFILFNGGLDIKIEDLKKAWKSTLALTFSSIFFTVGIIAIVGHLYGLSLLNSFILGFILCGIAATVVIPLTSYLKIGKQTKTVLILESALSDVICLIMSLALINAEQIGGNLNYGRILGSIVSSFLIATLIAFFASILWGTIIKRIRRFKSSMFLITAYVFIIYGITEILGYSGAIAALVFGICVANLKDIHNKFFKKLKMNDTTLSDNEMKFNNEIGFLLKTIFFVYIGICIPIDDYKAMLIGILITLLLILQRTFVAKHFSPAGANSFDKSIISTTVQKGLASAVLASLPMQYGLEDGVFIRSITFEVILFSIIISSFLIFIIEKSPRFAIVLRKYFNFSPTKATFLLKNLTQKLDNKIDKIKDNTFFDEEEGDDEEEDDDDEN